MAQYHIPVNDELLHGLLPKDQGLTKLLEQILNQILEEEFEDATAVLDYPDRYRRRLRTTNGVERLSENIEFLN
ncbi:MULTISPECIES: transposase [Anoxybacillaceae]|uniref:DNA polymerase IV n=1 Tax=Parageobacillus toebii TaxID=153151 RepID=A0A150MKD2_9BACL|nr:DNA polymerase IV [Parageobacillus toebii]